MNRTRRTSGQSRRGATTVEFAVTAPLLFLFVIGGIEFARMNMLRNTVANAAFDGARRGIVAGATADDCIAEANVSLNAVGVIGADVFVTPPTITPDDTTITVQVDVPLTPANLFMASQFFMGKTLSRTITLDREVN